MIFDKKKYWDRRNNATTKKGKDGDDVTLIRPLRGQGDPAVIQSDPKPSGDASIGFGNDGTLITKNRFYRRTNDRIYPKSSQLRKKNKRKK